MKNTTVAARYAKALFFVTEKRGETARALEDLKGMNAVLEPGSRVAGFLISPQVRIQDKREVLRQGLRDRTLPVVAVFLDLLLRKKRLNDFPTVVEQFEALVEDAQGIQRASVTSAVPLTKSETQKLMSVLEQYTSKKIKLAADVDPELLGGAMVRLGDRVVDRSVRTLLEAVEQQLDAAAV